ncbi:hypothetical protein OSH08_08700 [Kaistia geumhonensis]|uniref:Glycosyltransferase RgtA/B/C/D-like domain-containing protein n=1 Tax=Kaistia geumhonensis TaxID=410839 RepID=A0ABU0M4F4_9HYPH|nr:hypothetical protein [Kaistia geumhonensis]MCX5479082.1 hypothetical protein [Kaistia geumhonensis]MDQ0515698.1 hypothetical protein [Kaistia geumhonensis]
MGLADIAISAACAVALTLGSIGWGLLLIQNASRDKTVEAKAIPLAAALGIVFLCLIGAMLNIASAYDIAVYCVAGLVGSGWLVWSAFRPHAWTKRVDLWTLLPIAVVWLMFVVIPPAINLNDDTAAYLVFAKKLAETGATGSEYFSERRLFTFGGQFALQAPFASFARLRLIGVVEPGLGLTVLGWLIATLPTSRGLRRLLAFVVSIAVIGSSVIGANYLANTVPTLLPGSLLAGAVVAAFAWRAAPRDSGLLLVSALVLGAGSLLFRPTPLPFVGLLGLLLLIDSLRNKQIKAFVVACAVAALVIAPFALLLLLSSRTLFYPFLGEGVHLLIPGSAIVSSGRLSGISAPSVRELTTLIFALLPAVMILLGSPQSRRSALLVLALAVIAAGVIAVGVDGVALHRYTFATVFGCSVGAACLSILSPRPVAFPRVSGKQLAFGAAALGVLVLGVLVMRGATVSAVAANALGKRFSQPVWTSAFADRCADAQSAFPGGAVVLGVKLDCANAFDFARDEVLVHDQLGGSWADPSLDLTPTALLESLARSRVDWIIVPATVMNWSAEAGGSGEDAGKPRGWLDTLAVRADRMATALKSLVGGVEPTYRNDAVSVYSVASLCRAKAAGACD